MAHNADTAPRSTVVALVGADSDELLTGLADVPALVALSLREAEPAVAAHLVASVSMPYVVHDADPLEHVASAWVELYEERATLGSLEAEVGALLSLFASGEAVMPDYYVVAGPEAIEGTWRHWWLGACFRSRHPAPPCGRGCAHCPPHGRGPSPRPGYRGCSSTSPIASACAISLAPPDP